MVVRVEYSDLTGLVVGARYGQLYSLRNSELVHPLKVVVSASATNLVTFVDESPVGQLNR